jgi:hypothetical protein
MREAEGAAPGERRTLSEVLDELRGRGFEEHFQVVEGGRVRANGSGRTFAPGQVAIAEWHRFEGVSDPDDMAILYALETRTGVRGTIADAFGVYADPAVGGFVTAVARASGPRRAWRPRAPRTALAPRRPIGRSSGT